MKQPGGHHRPAWTRNHAFTLIELVTVIVIIGILSVVAVPMFLDYKIDAMKSTCKGAVGAMRAGIANFRAWSTTDAGGAVARFPTITELETAGTILRDGVPDNPFDGGATKNNVVDATGETSGTIVGSDGGWCYNPDTGEVWANTLTKSVLESQF
ncbi:MAG: prepilin-type N-terminal cleavage/methylation domain-containing protein [Phycisphaerae bacterium]|nr:prepilin-type N-terminal cleavage/methylation domain-containing protein [Phycisphaerae bacterium]